jgi:hypothetical protein
MHATEDHTSIVIDVLFHSSSIFCHFLHQQAQGSLFYSELSLYCHTYNDL